MFEIATLPDASYEATKSAFKNSAFEAMKQHTLEEAAHHFLKTKRPSTALEYEYRLRVLFTKYLNPKIRLSDYAFINHRSILEAIVLDPCYKTRRKRGFICVYKSFNTYLYNITNGMCQRADTKEFIKRLPLSNKGATKDITQEELRKVYDVLIPKYKVLLLLLLESGRRISEVLAVQVSDCNFETMKIRYVPNKQTCDIRDIEMAHRPETMLMLKECIGDRKSGPVFLTKNDRPIDRHLAARVFCDAGKRCGVSFHPHQARAYYITQAYKRGYSLYEICKVTFHTNLNQIISYIRDDSWENISKEFRPSI